MLTIGIATLVMVSGSEAQSLRDVDTAYLNQVVAENAPKTDARLITLHVKSVHQGSSAELTESEQRADPIFGLQKDYILVSGEAGGIVYRFKTSNSKADLLVVGKDCQVVFGMAFIDLKKHHFNVKDRGSAVFLVPNKNPEKEAEQFTVKIVGVSEK